MMNKYTAKGNLKTPQTSEQPRLVIDTSLSKMDFDRNHNLSPTIPNTYTPKNKKEIKAFRMPLMGRHCSEDEFKDRKQEQSPKDQYSSDFSNSEQDGSAEHQLTAMTQSLQFQNQGFLAVPRSNVVRNKNSHSKGRSNASSRNPMSNVSDKLRPMQKRSSGGPAQRSNLLKQTSSTTSADYSVLQSKVPSFVKNKISQKLSMQGFTKSHFIVLQKLGQGKSGTVLLVRQRKSTMVMAMKVVNKNFVIKENLLNQFIRQLKIQAFLDHPGVIKVYGFFSDEQNFYILMELGCDGQLYDVIANNKAISEEGTSYIAKSLLSTINFMHRFKILHRDIKPQNIVLIHGTVKICDFGWAVNKKQSLRSTFCGTPLYFSPQLLAGNPYDQKVDLWAIGILCFQIHLCCTPFDIQQHGDLPKIMTQEVIYPQDNPPSNEFKEFINAILEKDPKKRFSSQQLLSLPFISRYGEFETCQELCN